MRLTVLGNKREPRAETVKLTLKDWGGMDVLFLSVLLVHNLSFAGRCEPQINIFLNVCFLWGSSYGLRGKVAESCEKLNSDA